MNTRIVTGLVFLCLCLIPLAAAGEDFDGSKALLLSVIKVIECTPDGDCFETPAEEIDVPRFLKIDFEKKNIASAVPGDDRPPSPIERMENVDGKLILQGAEDGYEKSRDGFGWTLAISKENGRIVYTAAGEEEALVVFGATIPF
jgi:hypothetical protein